MAEECRKSLANAVFGRAPRDLADPHTSTQDRAAGYEYLLGISWTKDLVRRASAQKMSATIQRGLANPATHPYAKRLRVRLRSVGNPVAGEMSRRASNLGTSIEKEGLTAEASRQG